MRARQYTPPTDKLIILEGMTRQEGSDLQAMLKSAALTYQPSDNNLTTRMRTTALHAADAIQRALAELD